MNLIYYFFIFIIGTILGSFLSVILARLDEKEGILMGRSECPRCLRRLRWFDLIPLYSFIALGGKCRYCEEKISSIYPVLELSVAVIFVAYFVINGLYLDVRVVYDLAILFILTALLFFDYSYYILPDQLILSGLGISLAYLFIFQKNLIIGNLLTGLGIALFFGIIYLASRGEWMGFGDVKFAFLIGLLLGYPAGPVSVIIAVWLGALCGLGMMMTGRANMKTALPFGSFMGLSVIIFIIFNKYSQFLSYGI